MALGRKTGGRPLGSKNKSTLAREAEAAAAAVAADDAPRAVPTLSKIMKHFLDRADAEAAKEGGGDPAIITAMLVEARTTAAQLAQYQQPKLCSVKVGGDAASPLRTVQELDLSRLTDEPRTGVQSKSVGVTSAPSRPAHGPAAGPGDPCAC
jgi:hypothetical protein